MNGIDSGTQFDFTYAPGTSPEQIIGFEMAGAIWSSYLQDDVAVSIHVESTDQLSEDIVGAALPGKQNVNYKDLQKAMSSENLISEDDETALLNIPGKEFNLLIDGQQQGKTKNFKLTNANAKALNLLEDKDDLDGYILVNDLAGSSTVGWDYNALRNEDISSNNLDFVSVAMHEIGHILGFVSGIDDEGWLKVLDKAVEKSQKDGGEIEIKKDEFQFASPLDLYRYTEASAIAGEIDLSIGGQPFFSINGGENALGSFANGEYANFGGDGYQASHWQQDSSEGIMRPILPTGERRNIDPIDLTAMDVIGWDINPSESLSWQEIYNLAISNSNTAIIEDRSKDIEKMMKDSQSRYKGRPSSSIGDYWSSSDYSFQLGYWQYTTFEPADTSTAVIDESVIETELETDITIDESAIVTESDPNTNLDESTIVTELNSDTIANVFPEAKNDETQFSLSESDDDSLGTVGVLTDEEDEISLSSEATSQSIESDTLYYESPLLPGLLIPIEFY